MLACWHLSPGIERLRNSDGLNMFVCPPDCFDFAGQGDAQIFMGLPADVKSVTRITGHNGAGIKKMDFKGIRNDLELKGQFSRLFLCALED